MIQTSGIFLSVFICSIFARDVPAYDPHLSAIGTSLEGAGLGGQHEIRGGANAGRLSSAGRFADPAGFTGGHHQTEVVHRAHSWHSSGYDGHGGLGRFAEPSFGRSLGHELRGYSAPSGRHRSNVPMEPEQYLPGHQDIQGGDQRFQYDRQMDHFNQPYPGDHSATFDGSSQPSPRIGDERTGLPARQGAPFQDITGPGQSAPQGYHPQTVASFGNEYNGRHEIARGRPFGGYEVQQPDEHLDLENHPFSSAASQSHGPSHPLVDYGTDEAGARQGHRADGSRSGGYRIVLPSGSMEVAYPRGRSRASHQAGLQASPVTSSPASDQDPNRSPNAGIATIVNY